MSTDVEVIALRETVDLHADIVAQHKRFFEKGQPVEEGSAFSLVRLDSEDPANRVIVHRRWDLSPISVVDVIAEVGGSIFYIDGEGIQKDEWQPGKGPMANREEVIRVRDKLLKGTVFQE